MSFCALRIFPVGSQVDRYSYVGTDQNGQIIEEKWDNGLSHTVTATGVSFYRYKTDIKKDGEIMVARSATTIPVCFTDSRVALLCSKYEEGTISWDNVASDKSDKKKTKGKALVGHVRYEWLYRIWYGRKSGLLSFDSVSLTYTDGDRNYQLIIIFPKGTDTEFLANEILHRACKYRLAMKDTKREDDIDFFRKYSESGKIETSADAKEPQSIILPNSYNAPLGEEFRP